MVTAVPQVQSVSRSDGGSAHRDHGNQMSPLHNLNLLQPRIKLLLSTHYLKVKVK